MEKINMTPKLKWKVNPAPTGRYRAFEKRQWPTLEWEGIDRTAAQLECSVGYDINLARDVNHPEITVRLLLNIEHGGENQFQWKKLKRTFRTLDEAKDAAYRFIVANPQYWPQEIKNQNGTKT